MQYCERPRRIRGHAFDRQTASRSEVPPRSMAPGCDARRHRRPGRAITNLEGRMGAGGLGEAGGRLSDAAKCIIPKALAGMMEREVAAVIEAELRRVGFDKPAFDTIVASGPNSAVPHYRAGDRDLDGRRPGRPGLRRHVPRVCRGPDAHDYGGAGDATAAAAARRRRGGAGRGVRERSRGRAGDRYRSRDARRRWSAAGLGEAFGHGTGHGLGLEVHERPRVAPFRAELPGEPLQPGMVFTIEPGAYFPGWGGVRIEDDAVVTTAGRRMADRRAAILDVRAERTLT